MYLASTSEKKTALYFCMNSVRKSGFKHLPVLWIIHLHPELKCVHLNLIKEHSAVSEELEFLFVPYSVFTVKQLDFSSQAGLKNPHIIELIAAPDNLHEPEDLPLSPWN